MRLTKSLFFIITSAILLVIPVYSQNGIELFGEGNGNHVKLLWLPKTWQPNWTAFQVKFRIVSGDQPSEWTSIHGAPIFPEISRLKDLTNVESDPAALARLKSKLEKWLSTGQAKEIRREEYLQKLATDPDAVKGLYIPIALDYDFALVNGFGMVSRQFGAVVEVEQDAGFEYGLFVVNGQGQEQMVGTYNWQWGTFTKVELDVNLQVVPTHLATQLEVRWDFDYQAYLNQNLNGFNLYRRSDSGSYQKLNEAPLWAASVEATAHLSFFDKTAQPNAACIYAVAPLTLFGTEGQRQEVAFDPLRLPGKVEPPVLRVVPQEAGSSLEIRFGWDFPNQKQSFIRGFVLQRRQTVEASYEIVSPVFPPALRTTANTPPLPGAYYFYRLKVEDDFGLNLYSNELLLYYYPQIPPPPPTGLRGEFEKEGNRQFIRLHWDQKLPSDELTAGYFLYSNFPPDTKMILEGNIPLIRGNSYRYEVFNDESAVYRFAVTAVSAGKAESAPGNVATVTTPSRRIATPDIWPFSVEDNRITLNWEYESPPDLAGFRIIQNGSMTANENQLGPSHRQWVSPPLEFNTSYNFELQAVTASGVESRKSVPRTVPTGKKQ